MSAKQALRSQYLAALKMLKEAIVKCPPSVWDAPEDKDRFWSKARHALRYAHRDLHAGLGGFVPWTGRSWSDPRAVLSKREVIEYLDFLARQVADRIFHADNLERMIVGLRHIQQHTGELSERLGTREAIVLHWTEQVHRSEK